MRPASSSPCWFPGKRPPLSSAWQWFWRRWSACGRHITPRASALPRPSPMSDLLPVTTVREHTILRAEAAVTARRGGQEKQVAVSRLLQPRPLNERRIDLAGHERRMAEDFLMDGDGRVDALDDELIEGAAHADQSVRAGRLIDEK